MTVSQESPVDDGVRERGDRRKHEGGIPEADALATIDVHDEYAFSLCLTHDVDRPYKTYQSIYYAVKERDPGHLLSLLPSVNPYWQFEEIMALEDDLDVRSAFYFLNEQHLFADKPAREWLRPKNWKLFLGRYSIRDPDVVDVIHELDDGGWEIGLHGSYESYDEPERLRREKTTLEEVLGHGVLGARQHYLNLDVPTTWRYQAEVGLKYDTSLGSSTGYGFQHGHDVIRPFDDDFVAFPLTIMENALPDPGRDFDRAWTECRRLLEEAERHGAVMTILWHLNTFAPEEFPGQRRLYRRIVEYADDRGAWIGPPGKLYEAAASGSGDSVVR